MFLTAEGKLFEIEDLYARYSPLLSVMLDTPVPLDTIHVDGKDAIDIDTTASALEAYISFLQDKDFQMDGEVERFFEFMGHPNTMQYPLDYWKVKLQDNWIRDNFYRLQLHKNPYYGLVEVPIVNKVQYRPRSERWDGLELEPQEYKPLQGTVVAGGAALFMAGYSNHDVGLKRYAFDDIDVFFVTTHKKAKKILKDMQKEIPDDSSKYGPHTWSYSSLRRYPELRGYTEDQKVQFVLRVYTCPSEVVHGFDVDCVGFVYDGEKLYATKRALYAAKNGVNWFDPSRSSPSYAYRLIKYKRRGFNISLPLFTNININNTYLHNMYASVVRVLIDHACMKMQDNNTYESFIASRLEEMADDPKCVDAAKQEYMRIADTHREQLDSYIDELRKYAFINQEEERYVRLLFVEIFAIRDSGLYTFPRTGNVVLNIRPINDAFFHRVTQWLGRRAHLFPQDPVSLLILAQYYNITGIASKVSDYGDTFEKSVRKDKGNNWFVQHTWITQDPMKQVSSTIYPTPIDNIEEWYRSSPLYLSQ